MDALRDSVLATADSEQYQESRDFIGNNRDFPHYVGNERVLGIVDAMLGRFARIAFTGADHPAGARQAWELAL